MKFPIEFEGSFRPLKMSSKHDADVGEAERRHGSMYFPLPNGKCRFKYSRVGAFYQAEGWLKIKVDKSSYTVWLCDMSAA